MTRSSMADVEAVMLQACIASGHSDNPCVLAASHHLAAGGGRLRARTCLEAAARLGLNSQIACQLSSICELLHNASLLHDDLLDRTPLRRDQPSVWALFGDGAAVCAGDLMLAAAYASTAALSQLSQFPVIFHLVHHRTQEVILGQAAELAATATQCTTPEQYESLAQSKSASLLSLGLELPLSVAGYASSLPQARQVAASFSVAYQIADDLQDIEQDETANSLNLVTVLSHSEGLSTCQAKERAAVRADELLRHTVCLATELPHHCAAVLVDHAEALLSRIAPASGLMLYAAKG